MPLVRTSSPLLSTDTCRSLFSQENGFNFFFHGSAHPPPPQEFAFSNEDYFLSGMNIYFSVLAFLPLFKRGAGLLFETLGQRSCGLGFLEESLGPFLGGSAFLLLNRSLP